MNNNSTNLNPTDIQQIIDSLNNKNTSIEYNSNTYVTIYNIKSSKCNIQIQYAIINGMCGIWLINNSNSTIIKYKTYKISNQSNALAQMITAINQAYLEQNKIK